MTAFRTAFTNVLRGEQANDLGAFWLRKTKKPVLAVLLVQKEDQTPKLYRGTNMEVSMPTGSLCAERNVIGSALADDITLTRKDLKIIAVYSATIPSSDSIKPKLFPVEIPSVAGKDDNHYQQGPHSPQATSGKRKIMSLAAHSSPTSMCEGSLFASGQDMQPSPSNFLKLSKGSVGQRSKVVTFSLAPGAADADKSTSAHVSTLARTIAVEQSTGMQEEDGFVVPSSVTIAVEEGDLNPLKPCGACNEWLKKIAEVNPNMKVVTFTDAECRGVYVESVES
jgi:cytidine deaminase